LLTLAGVLALVALPVAVIVIGVLVWINRRRARAVKDWAARHGDLKRRLADVEALRRAEQGKLRRDWCREPGHDGPCAAVPSMIREHVGDPPYGRAECAETEGDCS
jgi:hypothetical protein